MTLTLTTTQHHALIRVLQDAALATWLDSLATPQDSEQIRDLITTILGEAACQH